MASRATVRIEGLRDLERALSELPKATGKNVLKRALMKAGAPIQQDAANMAPALRGHLKRSVSTGTQLTRSQRKEHRKTMTVEVFVGPGGLPQAHMQEFGTAHNPPKRFLTPAFEANKDRALASIGSDLADEIEKARQRLARKAARLAAKS